MADEFAAREVEFVLGIGAIKVIPNQALGRELDLGTLRRDYDAVFLGIGQAGVNALSIPGEELPGVMDAVRFIEMLRQSKDKSDVKVGRHVVVIGGGNTAIDAAVQAKRLGAELVTLVYRRGREDMPATSVEQDWALVNGVAFRHWAAPVAIEGDGAARAVRFARTELVDGRLALGEDGFILRADMVLKAVGQSLEVFDADALPKIERGRILVNPETLETSLPGVFAGGDCIAGQDLTVQAVADGKRAALAHQRVSGRRRPMADLRINFAGIKAPNPFWLASAPPTDKAYNVERAFAAGWGGVVWKTLGEDPPVVNVSSAATARVAYNGQR